MVTAFNLTFYLEDEQDYVPWSVLNRVLGYVDLMLSRSQAYGLFSVSDFSFEFRLEMENVLGIRWKCLGR